MMRLVLSIFVAAAAGVTAITGLARAESNSPTTRYHFNHAWPSTSGPMVRQRSPLRPAARSGQSHQGAIEIQSWGGGAGGTRPAPTRGGLRPRR